MTAFEVAAIEASAMATEITAMSTKSCATMATETATATYVNNLCAMHRIGRLNWADIELGSLSGCGQACSTD